MPAMLAAMSKRQRFSVELCQDHITVISWTRLLADAEQITTSEAAAPSSIVHATTIPGAQSFVRIATIRENLNTAASNLLESKGKLKRDVSNSIKKPAKLMLERKQDREGQNVVMSSPSRAPERGCQESRGKLKRDVSNSIKKPAKLMLERKQDREGRNVVKSSPSRAPERGCQVHPTSNVKRIIEAKMQFGDESMAMKLTRLKGKVHRSLPIASEKTSYRTKTKTKACFCCSKKESGALSSTRA